MVELFNKDTEISLDVIVKEIESTFPNSTYAVMRCMKCGSVEKPHYHAQLTSADYEQGIILSPSGIEPTVTKGWQVEVDGNTILKTLMKLFHKAQLKEAEHNG